MKKIEKICFAHKEIATSKLRIKSKLGGPVSIAWSTTNSTTFVVLVVPLQEVPHFVVPSISLRVGSYQFRYTQALLG